MNEELKQIGNVYKSENYSELCPDCGELLKSVEYRRMVEGESNSAFIDRDIQEYLRISVCSCGNVVLRSIDFEQKRNLAMKYGKVAFQKNNNQYKFDIVRAEKGVGLEKFYIGFDTASTNLTDDGVCLFSGTHKFSRWKNESQWNKFRFFR